MRPNELTAVEAARRIDAGELTVEALARACLDRVEEQPQADQLYRTPTLPVAPSFGPLDDVGPALADTVSPDDELPLDDEDV